jgi:hypothetical protein
MSFDDDPNEQAQVSGADFRAMCDEMRRLRKENHDLRNRVAIGEYLFGRLGTGFARAMFDEQFPGERLNDLIDAYWRDHPEPLREVLAAIAAEKEDEE